MPHLERLRTQALEGKARAHHAAALRLASEVGEPREQARSHDGLARAYHADADLPLARHHWQEALTLFAAIGAPDADDVRARLAAAGAGAGRGGNSGEAAGEPLEAVPGQG